MRIMRRFFRFLAAVALMCGFTSNAQAAQSEKREGFFKAAFRDMKESAKLQRQIDRANYQAVKLETKAFYEDEKTKSQNGRKQRENGKITATVCKRPRYVQ